LLYYTMPFIEGESLRARLARAGELPVREAVRVLRDVAAALAYAHDHGVVHRDIKPENVLLSGGEALVTDFGVAKALSASATDSGSGLTSLGVALGTPAYMAPEQAAADPHVDHRADVYAWGCLAYEVLTGQSPFAGRPAAALLAAHMTEVPEPVERRRPIVPPAVAALIGRCLEKRPADRPQAAVEVLQVLEGVSTPSGGMAPTVPVVVTAKPAPRRLVRWASAGALLLLAAGAAATFTRYRSAASALEPTLVAVAPFDVLDSRLALWHEGMVDVLSRSLDGAGPLRTVSPSVVIKRWVGRADRASAVALGRATGAGLVVFGTLQAAGDSVRADVTLFDARTGRVIGEVTRREAQARLDRLGDSLTVALLVEANQARSAAALRTGGVGGRSLPALKAYLRAEQEFRRARWDSARGSLEEAIRIDSAFPLALRRLGQVYGWVGYSGDSTGAALSVKAGALNRGLGARDSLLVLSESLMGGLVQPAGVDPLALQRRLLAVTAEAARRYPDDPDVWAQYGEARFHHGNSSETSEADAVGTFQRAVALDPDFAPAYYHATQGGLRAFGPDSVRPYATRMLALGPDEETTTILQTLLQLIEPAGRDPDSLRAIVARTPPRVLLQVGLTFLGYPDSAETGLVMMQGWAAGTPGTFPDLVLSVAERMHGHLAASRRLLEQVEPRRTMEGLRMWSAAEHGLLHSPIPAAYVAAFARSLSGPFRVDSLPAAHQMMPLWAESGDTVHLGRYERIVDSLSQLADAAGPMRREPPLVGAYLALARRDSAQALRRMLALADTTYDDYLLRFTRANLLAAAGRDAEAAELLERPFALDMRLGSDGLRMLQRGRVAERLGRREVALESYKWVADIWRTADPELQPFVTEARAGLARLTAERP
jgi:serine/threonine-protein kinase